jgi:glycosyltransferase involved in cell wall biosynthesis
VVVDEGPYADVRGLYRLVEERDEDLRVFRLSYRPSTGKIAYLPGVLAVAQRLRREGTPVDLLHAHIHRMGWAAFIVGALLRCPFVITENSTEWPTGTITAGALRRARIAFPRAELVCPVDDDLQRAIQGYGVRARFRVVPNTVDARTFRPRGDARTVAPARLVNVAFHIERKGLDVLLRAFRKVAEGRPGLALELIGDGPATPDLKRLAAELDVSDQVHFAGTAAPVQIAESLRAADLFVFASLSENMPLAVLEALCCGLPVVATSVGGIPDAVGDADGALVPPGDPDALAAAIETLLTNYDRFDQAEIAKRAAAQFSFDAIGRAWDEIYGSL